MKRTFCFFCTVLLVLSLSQNICYGSLGGAPWNIINDDYYYPYFDTGTISSSGTTVNGEGTFFLDLFYKGDFICVSGQKRSVVEIQSDTLLKIDRPFDSDLPEGSEYFYADPFLACYFQYYGNPILAFVIDPEGYIGVGVDAPLYPIEIFNGAYCSKGGVWTDASSREYKENIEELEKEQAEEAFEKLFPVTYNYKGDKEEQYVGFIAEDVPDLVATNDRKGLSPMEIVAVLTKIVKEQQKTISVLQDELNTVKREIEMIKEE